MSPTNPDMNPGGYPGQPQPPQPHAPTPAPQPQPEPTQTMPMPVPQPAPWQKSQPQPAAWQVSQPQSTAWQPAPSAQPQPHAPAPQPGAWQPTAAPAPQPAPWNPAPQPEPVLAPAGPVVESASATTDHANNHGGAFAYVLTAVVVVLLAVTTAGIGGCTGSLLTGMAAYGYEYGYGENGQLPYDDPFGLDNGWPDDGWLDEDPFSDGFGFGQDDQGSPFRRERMDMAEALQNYVDTYDVSLDDAIAATDYAGAQDSVRSYVKTLARTDSETSAAVTGSLQVAIGALEKGDRDEAVKSIQEAAEHAAEGSERATALVPPQDLPPAVSGKITEDLTDARGLVAARWDAVSKALEALAESGDAGISAKEFDDPVYDATDEVYNDAADDLLDALTLSAQNR